MEANRLEAEASLTQAGHDLQRTKVKAPFAGRIRNKYVDVGQFVNRGNPVARIYAVDYAEVRLPIPDDAAAFVDLPIDYRGEGGEAPQPKVVLTADFGGEQFSWNGRIVRTEGELDPRTRMIHAVARVEDPYGRGDDPNRPPFAVGLFVEAEIEGPPRRRRLLASAQRIARKRPCPGGRPREPRALATRHAAATPARPRADRLRARARRPRRDLAARTHRRRHARRNRTRRAPEPNAP